MQKFPVYPLWAPVQAGPFTPALLAGDFVNVSGREGNA